MLSYLIKRLFYFIPGLFLLTLMGFYICANVNEDPVSAKFGDNEGKYPDMEKSMREMWHLDQPLFYFSFSALSEPDTFYKIYNQSEKEAADRILSETGNWEKIENYRKKIIAWRNLHQKEKQDSLAQNNEIYNAVYTYSSEQSRQLLRRFDKTEIRSIFDSLARIYPKSEQMKPFLLAFQEVESAYKGIYQNPTLHKNYIPKITFYSLKNRYHLWLMGLFSGDWGYSYRTQMPVLAQLISYLPSSLLLSSVSMFLILTVGVGLGISMAKYQHTRWTRYMLLILFALDTLPSFWIAMLLLFLFANPTTLGIFLPHFEYNFGGLFLPIIASSIGGIVNIAQFIYQEALRQLSSDFVRTARAKGLDEHQILYKHVLKNAILPIIPFFGSFLPALISGSVLIEYIFSVGGMGEQIFQAIRNNDMPIILAIFTFTGFLTMLSFLLSDILLAKLDPRVSKKLQ